MTWNNSKPTKKIRITNNKVSLRKRLGKQPNKSDFVKEIKVRLKWQTTNMKKVIKFYWDFGNSVFPIIKV